MPRPAEAREVPSHPLLRPFQAWDRFWFRPSDPTVLGLMRICCGAVLLYVHFAYTFDLQEMFGRHAWVDGQMIKDLRSEGPTMPQTFTWQSLTPKPLATDDEELRQWQQEYIDRWGIHPDQAVARGHWLWSIWYHVDDPNQMAAINGLILLCMFLFMIGFCTRVTAVLSWAGMLCYLQRAPTSLFGMDTILMIVVLYLMIAPSGAALSVDRLIARWWATRRALREGRPLPHFGPPAPRISATVALRLLQIHLCVVYLVSGLTKLQGSSWWAGSAVWNTMANAEFSPMYLALYTRFLYFLADHRWLWELVVSGGTFYTLAFEISFAFLIWNPRWRWLLLTLAVLLHTGIAIFMGLVTFSMSMLVLLLVFVPPEAVHRLVQWLGRGPIPEAGLTRGSLVHGREAA